MQPKRMALAARTAADDKQAEDIVVMDVSKQTSLSHYFLVTHGNTDRHVRAIADHVVRELEKNKVRLLHAEGMDNGQWVLLDFGALIVHVFLKEIREFYSLERLWGDAPRL